MVQEKQKEAERKISFCSWQGEKIGEAYSEGGVAVMIYSGVSCDGKEAHIRLIHGPGVLQRTSPIPVLVTNGMRPMVCRAQLCMTRRPAHRAARRGDIRNVPPRTKLIPFDGK